MDESTDERRARVWRHAGGSLSLDHPVVMAVLNVTADSFHDGGTLLVDGSVLRAKVRHAAAAAVDAGARLLDIGGESTRPGAEPVDPAVERERVAAAIGALEGIDAPISVDTRRAEVADAALEAGAVIVNDVSGLDDPAMAEVVARRGAGVVIGHLRGNPQTMQARISFERLLAEVTFELGRAVQRALAAGISRAQIVVDPGVGFGKSPQQSAALVASAGSIERELGVPVMIGASRKSFIGAVTPCEAAQRLPGSLAAAVVAVQRGASVIRVHDVPETVQALAVAEAIERASAREEARA